MNDLQGEIVNAGCNFCDLPAARMMDQSAARFNDQAGFNILAAQQNFVMQQQAAWMELMRQSHTQSTTNAQMLFNNTRSTP